VVLRTKEALCCVRPLGGALALSTMNYADEIVPLDELELPKDPAPAPRELEMAERLVDSLTTAFEPARYHDTHREKVLALVEKKASGQEVVLPPEAPPAKVVNLADALAASLAASRRQGAASNAPSVARHAEPAADAPSRRAAPRREAARTAGHRKKRGDA
jgi:DNA end-binding protein Ku